jgi:hypothetical protein
LIVHINLEQSILRLCITTSTSIISVCGWMYMFGLNKTERQKMKVAIKTRLCNP